MNRLIVVICCLAAACGDDGAADGDGGGGEIDAGGPGSDAAAGPDGEPGLDGGSGADGGKDLDLVHWRYELQPDGDGTLLTESWTMTNPGFFREQGGDAEIAKRASNAKESIAATLAGMKATAES